MTISTTAANAVTSTTPTYGAGNVVRASNTGTGPVGGGSFSTTTSNLYWTGALSGGYTGGTNPMFLNYRQSFSGTNANWSNVRLILNPVNNVVTNNVGAAAPGSFNELGNITPGGAPSTPNYINTNIAGSTNAQTPVQWYHFNLTNAIGAANALDIDTFGTGAAPGGVDTRLILWQVTANGLVPVGNNDDIASGSYNNASRLSFGNTSPTFGSQGNSEDRGYGNPFTYTGADGAALAAGSYFISVSYYQNNAVLTNSTTSVVTGVGIDSVTTATYSMGTTAATYGDFLLNIRAIPTPGAAALLGLGGLVASRRRRA
jgi:hypothetical protein